MIQEFGTEFPVYILCPAELLYVSKDKSQIIPLRANRDMRTHIMHKISPDMPPPSLPTKLSRKALNYISEQTHYFPECNITPENLRATLGDTLFQAIIQLARFMNDLRLELDTQPEIQIRELQEEGNVKDIINLFFLRIFLSAIHNTTWYFHGVPFFAEEVKRGIIEGVWAPWYMASGTLKLGYNLIAHPVNTATHAPTFVGNMVTGFGKSAWHHPARTLTSMAMGSVSGGFIFGMSSKLWNSIFKNPPVASVAKTAQLTDKVSSFPKKAMSRLPQKPKVLIELESVPVPQNIASTSVNTGGQRLIIAGATTGQAGVHIGGYQAVPEAPLRPVHVTAEPQIIIAQDIEFRHVRQFYQDIRNNPASRNEIIRQFVERFRE